MDQEQQQSGQRYQEQQYQNQQLRKNQNQQQKSQQSYEQDRKPLASTYLRTTIMLAEWIGQPYKDLCGENETTDYLRELYLCACEGVPPEKIAGAKMQANAAHVMTVLRRAHLEKELFVGPGKKLEELSGRISGAEDALEKMRITMDRIAETSQNQEKIRDEGIIAHRVGAAAAYPQKDTTPVYLRRDTTAESVTRAVMDVLAKGENDSSSPDSPGASSSLRSSDGPRSSDSPHGSDRPRSQPGRQNQVSQSAGHTQSKEFNQNVGMDAEVSEQMDKPFSNEMESQQQKQQSSGWMKRRKMRKEKKKMLPFIEQVMDGGYSVEQIDFILDRLEEGDSPDEAAFYASPSLPVEVMERLRSIYARDKKGDDK